MIYLVLSIFFSTFLFVIFKYFGIYKIHTLKAIVVNYFVAFSLGFLLSEKEFSIVEIPHQDWFFGALFLGALFVSVFFLMASTTQRNGLSVASVAGKMSVVVPVFFGVLLYDESVTVLKIIGILLALISVYLVSVKEEKHQVKGVGFLFPILLFLGSGIIDTVLKYLEVNYVPKEDISIFSGSLFGIAAFFGVSVLFFNKLKKKEKFGIKNVIAGIVLGVPNYYSIVFLIKALQTEGLESSTLFTVNNVGIVVFSTFIALLLFKEKLSLKNSIGVLLAILGILILAIA